MRKIGVQRIPKRFVARLFDKRLPGFNSPEMQVSNVDRVMQKSLVKLIKIDLETRFVRGKWLSVCHP